MFDCHRTKRGKMKDESVLISRSFPIETRYDSDVQNFLNSGSLESTRIKKIKFPVHPLAKSPWLSSFKSTSQENEKRAKYENRRGKFARRLRETGRAKFVSLRNLDREEGVAEMAKRSRGSRGCAPRKRRRKNGFILYFLTVLKKMPDCPVTKVAQIAGCHWRKMSDEEKCRYARAAKKQKAP